MRTGVTGPAGPAAWSRLLRLACHVGRPARVALAEADLRRADVLKTADRRSGVAQGSWASRARQLMYERIWSSAASQVGAQIEPLPSDFWRMSRGARQTITRYHHVQIDDPVTHALALDKRVVHDLLTQAGIPTPAYVEVTASQPDDALRLLAGGEPVVVKPAAGTSGGAGVTCGVESPQELYRACLHAWRSGDGRVLVERQARGEEYRVFILDGEVLDVIRRRPCHVVGDGRSTIIELIERENIRREDAGGDAGVSVLDLDLDTILVLRRAGFRLGSVPKDGAPVRVKGGVKATGAAEHETVPRASVSDDLLGEAVAAAAAIGLSLAGIDLVTTDLSRSLADSGGAVLEINGTPALHYHYLVSDTSVATPVAVPLAERLLRVGSEA